MKRFLLRLLFKWADEAFKITYFSIDKKSIETWLFESFSSKGFTEYFKYEDLRLLKAIGQGQEGPAHWILIGRRLQLLSLYDDMRKSFELRKAAQQKAHDEQTKKAKMAEKS